MRISPIPGSVTDVSPFLPGLELTRHNGRWMSHGATVVQVTSDSAAQVARLVFGRSIAQVRALFEG